MNKALVLISILFGLLACALVVFIMKGDVKDGDVLYQTERLHTSSGPFETSTSTGRFALTEALVRNHSVFLTAEAAKFSLPDVVRYNGKFSSIFPPGVSILGIPLYLAGSHFGFPQLGVYITTIIFAVLNFALVSRITFKLGASIGASLMAGGVFLFATNALVYALTFMQHHYSTSVILLAVLNAIGERTVWKNIWLGMLFGAGLLIDVPNGLLLLPVLLFVIWSHFGLKKSGGRFKFVMRYSFLWMLAGVIPFLVLFGFYNKSTTGSYYKLGQAIGQFRGPIDGVVVPEQVNEGPSIENSEPQEKNNKVNFLRLKTRKLLHGFTVLLVGDERSWLYYSPVLLIGFFVYLYGDLLRSEKRKTIYLILSVILTNIVVYAMFGDPWGGWAFGSRYLIPAAALASVYVGLVLQQRKKSWWFMLIFIALTLYSIHINVLGAITTTGLPPKVEAQAFPEPVSHTYEFNKTYIENNKTSALFYNIHLRDEMSVRNFWGYYTIVAFSLIMFPYLLFIISHLSRRRSLTT